MIQSNEFIMDLKHIENDTVAEQGNGLYCKWSIPAGTVTRTSFSKEQYYNFFLRRYLDRIYMLKNRSNEELDIDEDVKLIKQAVDELFNNNLISLGEMIEKIKNSKEKPEEKDRLLREIRRKNESKEN